MRRLVSNKTIWFDRNCRMLTMSHRVWIELRLETCRLFRPWRSWRPRAYRHYPWPWSVRFILWRIALGVWCISIAALGWCNPWNAICGISLSQGAPTLHCLCNVDVVVHHVLDSPLSHWPRWWLHLCNFCVFHCSPSPACHPTQRTHPSGLSRYPQNQLVSICSQHRVSSQLWFGKTTTGKRFIYRSCNRQHGWRAAGCLRTYGTRMPRRR